MMLSIRPSPSRILFLRPLRPPNVVRPAPKTRRFTQNSQLLLIAQHGPRPQLPYLSQPSFKGQIPLNGPSQQLIRLLSTETHQFVRQQAWLIGKWTLILWTYLVLGGIAWYGIRIELAERKNPTPEEWSFWTAEKVRSARAAMDPKTVEERGYVNWAGVGSMLKAALANLEDPNKDGKGLSEPADGEEILIPGIGRAGFDISAKSWAWRAGYYEVIMSCAKAAEHLDGMVLDTTRNMVFPPQVMMGPSNPDPRPVPPYMATAPLEENCVAPFQSPEVFYMRVLTGKGFTTNQKLDAAMAYASFLAYKSLPESAEEMYKWGIDIAKEALPTYFGSDHIIDSRTSILKPSESAQEVSSNLLRATTALATHQARNGNISSALPILLSVLRARRAAPVLATPHREPPPPPSNESSGIMSKIFRHPPFPPPPPSGDDPFVRSSDNANCEESELMLYIGEILFAASPVSSEGMDWTQEAVRIADVNLQQTTGSTGADTGKPDESRKCKECLVTGVGNWEIMLNRLSSTKESEPKQSSSRWNWFGWSRNPEQSGLPAWEEQRQQIEHYKSLIVRDGIEDQLAHSRGFSLHGLWMG